MGIEAKPRKQKQSHTSLSNGTACCDQLQGLLLFTWPFQGQSQRDCGNKDRVSPCFILLLLLPYWVSETYPRTLLEPRTG